MFAYLVFFLLWKRLFCLFWCALYYYWKFLWLKFQLTNFQGFYKWFWAAESSQISKLALGGGEFLHDHDQIRSSQSSLIYVWFATGSYTARLVFEALYLHPRLFISVNITISIRSLPHVLYVEGKDLLRATKSSIAITYVSSIEIQICNWETNIGKMS